MNNLYEIDSIRFIPDRARRRLVRIFRHGSFSYYYPFNVTKLPVNSWDKFLPGFAFIQTPLLLTSEPYVIESPVLLVSHDCVYNLGHLMEDLLNWFLVQEVMQNITLKDLKIMHLEGLRSGTIHQGVGRFIANTKSPDSFGPFHSIFEVLFGGLISYNHLKYTPSGEQIQHIIFSKGVYVFPSPPKAFLWESFQFEDPCSLELQVRLFIVYIFFPHI